jgi:glycosyltransferase involved in cell wall biosynthesis
VPLQEVQKWHDQGVIRYLGTASDVRPYLADCHIYVLPSYHEGMPRTVLEAMATGRPILTTDAPGCRETVLPGENGFLVPVRDADALAERMIWFIEHRGQWERMGARSREMAEERFDVRIINQELMRIMGLAPLMVV